MAAKSDDEDDYMSDKFVLNSVDIRPSLVFKHSTKRKFEQERKIDDKNKKSSIKPRIQMESEHREAGLQTALGQENKGFALMQKMGYKAGNSLGKDGTSGRMEPIGLSIKSDRAGLGREEFLAIKRKEIAQLKTQMFQKRKTAQNLSVNQFRQQQQQKLREKQVVRDLFSGQKSCQQLDQAMEITEAPEPWFWPEIETDDKSDEDDEETEEDDENIQLEPSEKLEILTDYLRSTHHFCIWCGVAYNDWDDLTKNCPGKTSDDH